MELSKNYIYNATAQMDLTLYQYGTEKCSTYHSFGPAVRNHYLIHYILSGKGTYANSYSTYNLKTGQAFLITPGELTMYNADAHNPWTYAWIEFDGLKAAEYVALSGLCAKTPIYKPLINTTNASEKEFLLNIINNPKETPLYIMGNFHLFLDALAKNSSTKQEISSGKLSEFYIKAAISFIEQQYANPISVQDIANCCNLNRNYFGKLFKDHFNTSPQEFLIKYRLQKACTLLSTTSKSVGEIANLVGYDNPLHFSRAFKNVFAVSPRQWKNNNKMINN